MQRDLGYICDMLHEARMVLQFTSGKGFNDFSQDTQCQYAVIHAIEIIGEAAGHVSDEFRNKHSELPWHQIIGMRNRLIHGYGDIVVSMSGKLSIGTFPNLLLF